ncbi:hypothetical protein [Cyanobium sp. NS01]|uniref:hypothetical protein n=1 Tax=Cyanobium sp. NS01 TaxID=261284 RepID=UPI0016457DD7|nr:hypothetical protein [Cyanobium sp. NS01]QNI69240.1 hypothetical protein CyaNS01_00079 [Cyanobium sp. NS01]
MARNHDSHAQRYAAIEHVYSEREWSEVESQGEALLVDLPDDPTDPLRLRVILLLAHTRLYGLGDVATAKGYYRALLRQCSDASLRQIAEQGLEDSEVVARQQGRDHQHTAEQAAMPWLEQLDGDPGSGPQAGENPLRPEPIAVEVIEEPEQIEVAQADPERQQVVEVQEVKRLQPAGSMLEALRRQDEPKGFSPEEIKELSRGLLHVRLG